MDSRERFGWSDGDVVMKDEDGRVMTVREVKEAQLERARSEVEADVAADTGSGEAEEEE